MNDARHKVKRKRERIRVNGSNANNKICFEVRAPSSTSPPSHRRILNPLTCPHRTPTQGTSTEDLEQLQPGVHNSSLYKHNLSLEAKAQNHQYQSAYNLRDKHKAKQGSPHTWGIQSNCTTSSTQRGKGTKPSNDKGLQLCDQKTTNQFLFPQTMIL